ncbi:M10 family metallopeptidase C-terminal domain-containing protein [Aestuariivirga sp.]|uniref:M10 family metallopeptidase C-terminal domain-containing protein n=1 Tax=Aestuariivirga sp. TaxID=2650926 RepID=UPI00391ABD95
MAVYVWNFGSADEGLQFKVEYDTATQQFTVIGEVGSFDLNALWFSDGDTTSGEGGTTLVKKDSSLNMNGTGVLWDDYYKVSETGLGSAGEAKASFITAGESLEFNLGDMGLVDFNPATAILGVRATSTSTEGGSIKWVDTGSDLVNSNTPPDAVNDELEVDEDAATDGAGNVLDNDSDTEDGKPTVQSFKVGDTTYAAGDVAALGDGATLSVAANGDVSLVQNGAYNGLDGNGTATVEFSYTVVDGGGLTDTADATITVNGVEDPTIVENPIADKQVNETEGLTFSVAGTFADPDTTIGAYSATLGDGSALPSWIVFDPITNQFTITAPEVSVDAVYDIKVSASGSNPVDEVFQLTVKADQTDAGPSDTTGFVSVVGTATYTGTNSADNLIGDGADNTIRGNNGGDTIYGMGGDDDINGNNDPDVLYGGSGNDILLGSNGSDTIYGGSGSDQVTGGGGADNLYGGFGADTFIYAAVGDSTNSAKDIIHDFASGLDEIDLQGVYAGSLNFNGGTAANYSVWYTTDATSTTVFADINGDATADIVIGLTEPKTLTADDFLL